MIYPSLFSFTSQEYFFFLTLKSAETHNAVMQQKLQSCDDRDDADDMARVQIWV